MLLYLCSCCASLVVVVVVVGGGVIVIVIVVVVVVVVIIIVVVVLNPPPPSLVIVLVCFGGMCLGDMLGKALASLNCRGIAEPELLLCGVGGVCARAADVGGYFIATLATAPLLRMMFPLAARLATSSLPDC